MNYQPPISSESTKRRRRRFQFSMLTLLIAVTVVAAFSPLLPYLSQQFVASILLMLVLVAPPVGLGAFAVYCRGRRQSFFAGAAAASLGPLLTSGSTASCRLTAVLAIGLLQLVACSFCGYLTVAIRRFVERSGWDRPDGDDVV